MSGKRVLGMFGMAVIAALGFAGSALAQGAPIKVGVLHSLSGTMAISETTLKDTMLFLIDEQNKKGGVLGKKLEPVVVDPAVLSTAVSGLLSDPGRRRELALAGLEGQLAGHDLEVERPDSPHLHLKPQKDDAPGETDGVLGMLDQKSKGKEIVINKAPTPKYGQVIDIMDALKRSMERVPAKKKPATATAAKKKRALKGKTINVL